MIESSFRFGLPSLHDITVIRGSMRVSFVMSVPQPHSVMRGFRYTCIHQVLVTRLRFVPSIASAVSLFVLSFLHLRMFTVFLDAKSDRYFCSQISSIFFQTHSVRWWWVHNSAYDSLNHAKAREKVT